MSTGLDRRIVEELYRRYGYQVEARCRRLLSIGEAADAAQEVFVRLIRKGGSFRGDAEWMSWLYRIATNVCLNRLRSRGRRREELCAEAPPEATSAGGQEDGVLRRQLLGLLHTFDAKTQQIAVYHFVDGLSQGEIAELVGLSRVSVNKRLARFRAEARHRLERAA